MNHPTKGHTSRSSLDRNSYHSTNTRSTMDTFDTSSLYSSDLSGMSNDTFEITRRGRQDRVEEGRLDRISPRGYNGHHNDMNCDPRWSSGSANHHHYRDSSSNSSNSSNRRRVSFGGQKIINEGAYEFISFEEMQIRWWSQEDLENIKRNAKEMSLKLRKLAKEKGCYVETAHKKTSLMLTNSFQELVKMSASSPDQDLRHWCARSDGRRGLERFASKEYGNTRKTDVIGTRNAIFHEQEKQRKRGIYSPENIAKVSKANSRRSRTFSLFMGEADAQTVPRSAPTRTSSKRAKAPSHSPRESGQQPKQKQRRVPTPPRAFEVEAPVLTSSA